MATQLDLSRIIDVSVSVSSASTSTETFNEGLIIGPSTIISDSTRIKEYTALADMITDGFSTTSPEYIAATLYFNADSVPSILWVGRQNTTNGAVKTVTIDTAGTGYAIDNVLTVVQSGGSNATLTVTSIGASVAGTRSYTGTTNFIVGDTILFDSVTFTAATSTQDSTNFVVGSTITDSMANLATALNANTTISAIYTAVASSTIITVTEITAGSGNTPGTMVVTGTGVVTAGTATTSTSGTVTGVSLTTAGTGYSVGTGLATTVSPSGGTGCTINVTAIGETPLAAVQACRAASNAWYACLVTSTVKADHIAIAAYCESMTPNSTYFYTTSDADALAGTTGNVFETLKSASYSRAFGIYSTTAQAAAAVMGEAMGLNTGLANSAFTLKFKTLTGVTAEALTASQVNIIEGNNGNVYVNYNSEYDILEQGVMSKSNTYFDQIINRDMLVNDIQQRIMNLFTSTNKVPLTDAGVTSLIHQVNLACASAVTLGYIAPGTWDGSTIINLSNGDSLTTGYLVQAYSVSTLTSSQRAARQSPTLYVAILEASAIHSVVIAVYVEA